MVIALSVCGPNSDNAESHFQGRTSKDTMYNHLCGGRGNPQRNWAASSTGYSTGPSMPDEEQEVWWTLSSHPRVLWTPELHMPLFCAPPLSCVLGGGTLRTCVLRPPGIYGPEEQRHLPRVAVCPPSLPRTRGRRSQVDVLCLLIGSWSLSRGSVPARDSLCWEATPTPTSSSSSDLRGSKLSVCHPDLCSKQGEREL